MNYPKAKVYFDGSHYIANPHEEHPERRRKPKTENPEATEKKEQFEKAYKDNSDKKKKERNATVLDEMKRHFDTEEQAEEYVAQNLERKQRNLISKRMRLWRKVNLQRWDYFATFTYDSKKQDEVTFRRSLSNCLKHLSSRKDWKYVGVWERGSKTERLHFHALLYIPDSTMVGELTTARDFSYDTHGMQTVFLNTFFGERYGRTAFAPIVPQEIGSTVGYLTKYMEKTGERIVYSKNLPQYFVSDILESDVICRCGIEDRKLLLGDNFTCITDGEIIGQVSPEIIEKMPKSN